MRNLATVRTVVNSAMRPSDRYDARELALPNHRPGCNDHINHPSRVGGELRYRDGRVEKAQ